MSIRTSFNPMGTLGAEPPLPPGYKRAIYLRSSADQYIDTGVTVTPQTRVLLDVEFLKANTSSYNGCLQNRPLLRFTVSCSRLDDGLSVACGGTDTELGIQAAGIRHRVVLSGAATATVDGTPVQLNVGPPPPKKFWLFARNQDAYWPDAFPSTQKLYRFKAWDGELLVRDMVPAVRLADGKPCMVDVLTGTPYFNLRPNADFTTNFDE